MTTLTYCKGLPTSAAHSDQETEFLAESANRNQVSKFDRILCLILDFYQFEAKIILSFTL